MKMTIWLCLICGSVILGQAAPDKRTTNPPTSEIQKFSLECLAFKSGTSIPAQYTADGKDISPALKWTKVPIGTKSLLLICDDPDAPVGTWVHWVVYNINPELPGLPDGIPSSSAVIKGRLVQGQNSWKRTGYNGPAPPRGKPHRYFFKLYALDIILPLSDGATKDRVVAAAKGHVIGQAAVMGTYQRPR